jgi:osmotically-inducible protein OsmY
LAALVIGALALGLAACDQPPSAEKVGRSIDETVAKAGQKVNEAANTAGKTAERAANAAGEKLAAAGQAVDNTTLATRVKAALIAAPGLESSRIDVDAANGVVTLLGTAENATKRDLAERLASNVDGVTAVRNQIVIPSGS